MTDTRALLLDSSMLVAYERDKTARAQNFVLEAIADGRILVASALSVAVSCAALGGIPPVLSWLIEDPDEPLQILPLSHNAVEVGALAAKSGEVDLPGMELAHVILEASQTNALVVTYEPQLYRGQSILIVDMRPE